MCPHGDLVHRRKTAEAALKKAREMSRAGCYDIYITTPEKQATTLPSSSICLVPPPLLRAHPKTHPPDKLIPISRSVR